MKHLLLLITTILVFSNLFSQNQKPVAVNDSLKMLPGTTLLFNPLLNDYDPEGDYFHIISAFGTSYCQVFQESDSTITIDISISIPSHISSITFSYTISEYGNIYQNDHAYIVIDLSNPKQFDSLNINNIGAKFHPAGNYFNNCDNNFCGATYEYPAGSGNTTIFSSALWIGGYDQNNNLRLAAERFIGDGPNYCAGPVRNIQSNTVLKKQFWNKVHKISRAEIELHRAIFWAPNYQIIPAIANWPAHGDTASGESFYLAPFVDVDGNGIYNPSSGDYPKIKGDQAIYLIFNDLTGTQYPSGGLPLGIEIHQMAYAYNCTNDSALNNTIFVDYKIYNHSNNSYNQVFMGIFTDLDIGDSYDDYIGCDTNLQMYYGYNRSGTDNSGYGNKPPIQAIKFLSDKMDHFMYFQNTSPSSLLTYPHTNKEYYNKLKSMLNDTLPLTYGGNGINGTQPFPFAFPGDPRDSSGWSQQQIPQLPPTDVRGIASIGPLNLPAGGILNFDIAYITAGCSDSNHLNTLDKLRQYADTIQWVYETDSMPFSCSQTSIAIQESYEEIDFQVFPVPTQDILKLKWPSSAKASEYKIYSISGNLLEKGKIRGAGSQLVSLRSLKSGMYIFSLEGDFGEVHRKIIKN
ncbi:MAG: T9SS type A sorting domain-containing protein [Bacteroidales bacterium]|nr:T9SS type A sorting domain-containing protein [Bacteroidales bacterium]